MSQSPSSLEQILEAHIQTLALTLRPATVTTYRCVARGFLGYLHAAFPQVRRLSQLRRDPTCSAGSVGCTNNNRPCATNRAPTICSASGACWTTWPPTATPSSRT